MSDLMKKREEERSLPGMFNRLMGQDFFGDFFEGDVPAINVKESKRKFAMEISTPGFDKKDLDVEVNGNILTISGRHSAEHEEKDEDERVLRREFSSRSFSRSFILPENVEAGKIDVKQKNGILVIDLPKLQEVEKEKVKKLEIK